MFFKQKALEVIRSLILEEIELDEAVQALRQAGFKPIRNRKTRVRGYKACNVIVAIDSNNNIDLITPSATLYFKF